MNGIHDMGGMQGFGPVQAEDDEPVFHAPWEGRVFGIIRALAPHGVHDPDGLRFAIESMDPARYLATSYYEKRLLATEKALLDKGFLTEEELASKTEFFRDRPDSALPRREDAALRDHVLKSVYTRRSPHREVGVAPRFHSGDTVTVRNVHPRGHTRLPRYVRGRRGTIARTYGVHDFQDSVPEGSERSPQPVYNVRFDARELWGESAEANQTVHLDMWESYLEPVQPADERSRR